MAKANWRPPRPWRSLQETRLITSLAWQWFLHHRFYREDPLMPLEQAKLLAYCIAAEVADQDNSVGGQIEVEVITPEKSESLRGTEKYERARQRMAAGVRSVLDSFR
jgi:hypothetical protein